MIENKKITKAEEIIQALPYTGHIILTFIRVSPTLKAIHKKIPLSYLSPVYKQVYDDLDNSGIYLRLRPHNVGLSDYYKFMCKLFPDFEVKDCQSEKVGKPDFFLLNKETEFYIEFKNGNDGIRHSQMEWIANNKNKEVWFLFLGGLEIEEDGQTSYHYEKP